MSAITDLPVLALCWSIFCVSVADLIWKMRFLAGVVGRRGVSPWHILQHSTALVQTRAAAETGNVSKACHAA